jgi:cytochrome P450
MHQAFTQALFYLATHQKYVDSLREEVDAVIAEFGWTKAGLDHMHKVDSFIHESQRLNPPSPSKLHSTTKYTSS